jgi:hypothetical protein
MSNCLQGVSLVSHSATWSIGQIVQVAETVKVVEAVEVVH